MEPFFIRLLANVLYFYSARKRRDFRRRYSRSSRLSRKLFQQGIIGEYTYVGGKCAIVDSRSRIGKFCSIAKNVSIGTTMHPIHTLTTHPVSHLGSWGTLKILPENRIEFQNKRPVRIGNDVWIGFNAVLMDGITVGDGAVIGAGAVVTKDIPPYAVAVGVPARVIKYRFDAETIQRLLKARWWDRPPEIIAKLPQGDISAALEILEKTPEGSPPEGEMADMREGKTF